MVSNAFFGLAFDVDVEYAIAFWVTFVLIAFILVSFGVFFLASLLDRLSKRKIEAQSNSVRIFKINMHDNHVVFFNTASIRTKREMDLTQFYSQFMPSEQDKVKRWLHSLLDNQMNTQDFLEVDVNISKYKKPSFSLLKVISVNSETQVIHLESYILKYISGTTNKKGKSLSSIEDVKNALLHSSPLKGATIGIKFYNSRAQIKYEEINYLVFTQLKDVIAKFITSNRYLLKKSNNELIFVDTKIVNQEEAIALEKSIADAVKRFLILNSYSSQIKFAFSIVENKHFPKDADKLIAQAEKLSLIAAEDGDEIRWYDQSARIDESTETSYHTEVSKVINEKKLRFLYRPVVDAEHAKTIGYFSSTFPVDSMFSDIDDLKEYSRKSGDDHLLFSWIAKNLIPTFVNEKDGPDLRLFFDVSIEDKLYISKSLSHLSGVKEAKLVLQFKEEDLINYAEGEDNLIKDLFSFLEKGYSISLVLTSKELSLSQEALKRFDYFVLDIKNIDIRSDTRTRLKVLSNAEKLLKYNRPIIMNNVESWPSIELIIKNGITCLSSETIMQSDVIVKPIPVKIMDRLSNYTKE